MPFDYWLNKVRAEFEKNAADVALEEPNNVAQALREYVIDLCIDLCVPTEHVAHIINTLAD